MKIQFTILILLVQFDSPKLVYLRMIWPTIDHNDSSKNSVDLAHEGLEVFVHIDVLNSFTCTGVTTSSNSNNRNSSNYYNGSDNKNVQQRKRNHQSVTLSPHFRIHSQSAFYNGTKGDLSIDSSSSTNANASVTNTPLRDNHSKRNQDNHIDCYNSPNSDSHSYSSPKSSRYHNKNSHYNSLCHSDYNNDSLAIPSLKNNKKKKDFLLPSSSKKSQNRIYGFSISNNGKSSSSSSLQSLQHHNNINEEESNYDEYDNFSIESINSLSSDVVHGALILIDNDNCVVTFEFKYNGDMD